MIIFTSVLNAIVVVISLTSEGTTYHILGATQINLIILKIVLDTLRPNIYQFNVVL